MKRLKKKMKNNKTINTDWFFLTGIVLFFIFLMLFQVAYNNIYYQEQSLWDGTMAVISPYRLTADFEPITPQIGDQINFTPLICTQTKQKKCNICEECFMDIYYEMDGNKMLSKSEVYLKNSDYITFKFIDEPMWIYINTAKNRLRFRIPAPTKWESLLIMWNDKENILNPLAIIGGILSLFLIIIGGIRSLKKYIENKSIR